MPDGMRAALASQDHSGLTLTARPNLNETLVTSAARKGNISRFVLVRMEQIGEPEYTADGKGMVHVRLPWFRETDGSWGIDVKDIVAEAVTDDILYQQTQDQDLRQASN